VTLFTTPIKGKKGGVSDVLLQMHAGQAVKKLKKLVQVILQLQLVFEKIGTTGETLV
jgi:hypothetical protein